MLSFVANIAAGIASARSYKANASHLQAQAGLARSQGKARRNAAYAEAAAHETAARARQEIAADNLRTIRENQTRVTASIRAKRGASGFTSEGTAQTHEQQAQAYFDKAVANAALSASIDSINAWQTANATRRQGELALMAADIQGMQLDASAQQARTASRNILTGTIINSIVGAGLGIYSMGKGYAQTLAYNSKVSRIADRMDFASEDEKAAWIADSQISPGTAAWVAGDSAASWGFNASSMLNIWTAGLTRNNNWGGNMSILMGNTPGIPDNRYSLSSLTD